MPNKNNKSNMKILLLDIETSPNTAYVWKLFKENIPLARLMESSETMCWAAKWYGDKKVMYDSIYESEPKAMILRIHELMDEADMVVHYYGTGFDVPTLNKEFLLHGLPPPSPAKQVDLYKVVKSRFKFVSYKLDYVAQKLGLGQKKETSFQLWVDCMAKKPEAWKKMKAYNQHDVLLLEKVYDRIKPWIKGHANYSVYEGAVRCPNCANTSFERRGFHYTAASKYQRYHCKGCGNWFRSGASVAAAPGDKAINI